MRQHTFQAVLTRIAPGATSVSGPNLTQTYVVVDEYQRLMGTQVGVHVSAQRGVEQDARAAISACLAWLKDVERTLTRFDARSELCRLNTSGGRWRQVSELLYTAVEQGIAAAVATDGLFDPTLLPVLEGLGYDRDFALVRAAASQPTASGAGATLAQAAAGDWRGVELDAAGRRIRLPHGTRLDLGGIAKGWAADLALEGFFEDFPDVIVNVGGDIRVRGGPRSGEVREAWPIGISASSELAPALLDRMPVVTLASGGLATSGAGDRWWYQAGTRRHHLLDPRTGRPAQVWIDSADESGNTSDPRLIATATALAPSAAHAEIAAKVAILRGYPDAFACVEQAWDRWIAHNADSAGQVHEADSAYGDAPVALLLRLGSGEVVCSANMRAYLDLVGGGGNAWLT